MTDYEPAYHHPRPEPHRAVIRAVPHPGELDARGIPITCPQCAARRDWLLLNVRHQVFVRCRCAAEWHEPDLTRAYFDQHFTEPEHEWDDFDSAMRALAFDGLLAGTTWG
ncbi:hypothetical protein AB0F92_15920 [Kitasatospora aureofaciens]|uniref:hypothetical protein n=1 Tax=Kitasatospora aureofaciens TaxID=1894 RepID=UPI000928E302|nr:hypothetical protein CP971_19035 [Streptomyces viridifaciens]UKZ07409.1 hypothetical protein BOQ63_025915 [Streptomyces viridifaciens]